MPRKKAPPGSLLKRPPGRVFIKEWREYRETTQEELISQFIDLTRQNLTSATLSRIENSKSPYSQRQLEAFAEILACSPADLVMRNPTSREPDDLLWSKLDREAKETVRPLLESLVARRRA
jgi:transcriptional regulator with XRE-family HTH domain